VVPYTGKARRDVVYPLGRGGGRYSIALISENQQLDVVYWEEEEGGIV